MSQINFTMVYRGKTHKFPLWFLSRRTIFYFGQDFLCNHRSVLWQYVTICDIVSIICAIIFFSQRVKKLVYYEKMSSYWDLLTYYIIHLWIIYWIFVVQWYRNTFIRVKSPFKTSIILVSDSLTNLIVWFFTEHLSWFCSYPQTWSELDPNPN